MVTDVTPMPTDKAHRIAWIKFELARRGLNISTLAKRSGFKGHTAISQALRRTPKEGGGKAERAVARALGLKPWQIWPERYPSKTESKMARAA